MSWEDAVESLLLDFLRTQQTEVDEQVLAYLAAGLIENDEADLEELSDMLAGFSQNFGCLPRSAQHSEAADLVQRVHEVRQRQLPHPTQPPATSSAAQQLGSLSLVDSHSANTVHAEEEAHSQDVQQPQQQELDAMRELCALDNVSNDFLLHALMVKGGGSLQEAAAWLLEVDDLAGAQRAWEEAQQREQEQRRLEALEQEKAKRRIAARFGLEAVPEGGGGAKRQTITAWGEPRGRAKGRAQQRYRDGAIVSTRGEKYVVEKTEEWNGGSKGKIYTKGKRGPGVIAG